MSSGRGKKDLSQSLMSSAPAGGNSSDPYFLCRDDLSARLKKLNNTFENWEVLLRQENTETSASFQKVAADLSRRMKGAKRLANELNRTVSHVRQNKKMFPHISSEELESRQQFVDTAKRQIQQIQATMRSPATTGKIAKDRDAVLSGRNTGQAVSVASTAEYVENNREYQQRILAQQDRDMEEIDIALDGIKDAGTDIHNELEEQNEMLRELNKDVEKTQNAMDKVNESLGKLLNTKDGCQLGIVIAMSVVCVISVILLVTAFV